MRKYDDCIRTDGLCGVCSLANGRLDCHNKKISTLLYQRSIAGIGQKELGAISGVNSRQIQKYESGEYDINNITLKNAIAIAKALNCKPEDLL